MNSSTYTIFSEIFQKEFPISYFFQKISKIFGLEFLKISKFSSHQITILRLILENCLFLWNQSGFTVVSNLLFWNHLWPKVVSSDFGGFFFFGKVSSPKKDQILAKIHHMLGFNKFFYNRCICVGYKNKNSKPIFWITVNRDHWKRIISCMLKTLKDNTFIKLCNMKLCLRNK